MNVLKILKKSSFLLILTVIMILSIGIEAAALSTTTLSWEKYFLTVSNDYIQFSVDREGGYTIATTGGNPSTDDDDNKRMTWQFQDDSLYYSFPYLEYSWNSSKISIDNFTDTFKSSECTRIDTLSNRDRTHRCSYRFNRTCKVHAEQEISIVNNDKTGLDDTIEIKYIFENIDSEFHDVGLSINWYLRFGDKSVAPLRISGYDEFEKTTTLSGDSVPDRWQFFDTDSEMCFYTSLSDKGMGKPDRVTYGYSYAYERDRIVGKGIWTELFEWDKKPLAPGERTEFTVYYGVADYYDEISADLTPPLAVSVRRDPVSELTESGYTSVGIDAIITNINSALIHNPYISLNAVDEVHYTISPQKEYSYSLLNTTKPLEFHWTINFSDDIEEGLYEFEILCGADNIEPKRIIFSVAVISNYVDNRFNWGDYSLLCGWSGQDNYKFINSDDYFIKYKPSGFLNLFKTPINIDFNIPDDYFNILISGMDKPVVNNIIKSKKKIWNGSCYGMACTATLFKTNYLNLSKYSDNAFYTNDLSSPNTDNRVEGIINYYQLLQFYPDIDEIYYNYISTINDEQYWLNDIIRQTKKVRFGGMPVIIGIEYKSIGNNTQSHAVVAYDIDIGNFLILDNLYSYRVSIYNPNKYVPSYLYISGDMLSWYFEDLYELAEGYENIEKDTDGNENKIIKLVISDITKIDLRNPETGEDHVVLHGYNRNFKKNTLGFEYTTPNSQKGNYPMNNITTIIDNFQNSERSDSYQIITDDNITDHYLDDDKDTYIFINENNSPTDSTIYVGDYMYNVTSDSYQKITADKFGRISIQGNVGNCTLGHFTELLHDVLPWYSIDVYNYSNASEAALYYVDDGLIYESDNMEYVEVVGDELISFNSKGMVGINYSTSYPSVKFMAVDDDTLGVYVDTDGNGEYETLIADSDGTEYSGQQPDSGDKTDNTGRTDNTSKTDTPSSTDDTGNTNNTDDPTPADSRETSEDPAAVVEEQSLPGESNTEKNTTPVQTSAEPADSPAEERTEVSSEPVSSADSSFAPFAAGILAVAVIAAFVIVLLRRRKKGN